MVVKLYFGHLCHTEASDTFIKQFKKHEREKFSMYTSTVRNI